MAQEMWELIKKPKLLHRLVLGPPKLKPPCSPEPLIKRIKLRKWTIAAQEDLMLAISEMREELKFIERLPKCRIAQLEVELDVERYFGTNSFWWVCLENNQYLEARYRTCPKERNYHIGDYWEQLNYYREHGTTDVPGVNTLQFILDRAKWAYKIYGKQIYVARKLLKMLRNWNFDDENQLHKFNIFYEKFGRYDVALSIDL